eukprot:Lithocolla_globosa_v1_NODE_2037_length_2198_cov_8.239851.p2 type:complete len:111 gc:universal NODE_2037_length_2198_cov_8.239851:522-190(-)
MDYVLIFCRKERLTTGISKESNELIYARNNVIFATSLLVTKGSCGNILVNWELHHHPTHPSPWKFYMKTDQHRKIYTKSWRNGKLILLLYSQNRKDRILNSTNLSSKHDC